jgi:DNA invertase Pin-like site-specific DNA recombinase
MRAGASSPIATTMAVCREPRSTVRAGEVSIMVVYKVDRLTRSITDFAKLVELFDQSGVSFVTKCLIPDLDLCIGRYL